MKVAVGIVVYKRTYFIERCSQAVKKCKGVDAVYIWDNTEDNIGQDAAMVEMHRQFFNDGYDIVFTMEDGCLVMPWTFEKLTEVLTKEAKNHIGIVCPSLTLGPVCQAFPHEYLPTGFVDKMVNYPSPNSPWKEDILNTFEPHPFMEWNTIKAADPFLWGLTKDTWKKVGEIDAEFWQGWGTLNDYCYRAREKGIHNAVVWDAFTITWDRHCDPKERGYMKDREEWMGRGINRLRRKYINDIGDANLAWAIVDSNYKPLVRLKKDVSISR